MHKWLAHDLSDAPNASSCASAGTLCFIGQPVDVTSAHAVLRLALGAETLLELDGTDGEVVRSRDQDAEVVAKLSWVVTNYDALEKWQGS